MAVKDPVVPSMSPDNLPDVIGLCVYCGGVLYVSGPTSRLDEPLSHVGCAVHARRTGKRA